MNYELYHKKLQAVRKEIRQNVPMLKLIDDTIEKMNREFEEILWFGQVCSPVGTAPIKDLTLLTW